MPHERCKLSHGYHVEHETAGHSPVPSEADETLDGHVVKGEFVMGTWEVARYRCREVAIARWLTGSSRKKPIARRSPDSSRGRSGRSIRSTAATSTEAKQPNGKSERGLQQWAQDRRERGFGRSFVRTQRLARNRGLSVGGAWAALSRRDIGALGDPANLRFPVAVPLRLRVALAADAIRADRLPVLLPVPLRKQLVRIPLRPARCVRRVRGIAQAPTNRVVDDDVP
jgi:hypothetical protein